MLDFDEARARVVASAKNWQRPAPERVSLAEADGRVLAEEVVSPIDLPAADYSAMDGYAVRFSDVSEAGVQLPMTGECRTGHDTVAVEKGQCVRIFTGAHIPPGADTVVMQENVARDGEMVIFNEVPTKAGAHIRRKGEDLRSGQRVLSSGTRLSGFHLGLLATVERTEVLVAQRPRVAIVCTGDELRPPGALFESGHLAESNSVALSALVRDAGGDPQRAALVRDEVATTKQALADAAKRADVVLTVGGVSVGDHDVVVPAWKELGATTIFHKARIKPGKPVFFAELDGTMILGLPGNPSSAQVNFALFGYPLLRMMQGDVHPMASLRRAKLRNAFKQKPGRRGFYRARLDGSTVEILSNQASGASTSMAWANALVVLGEDVSEVAVGDEVGVVAYSEL